MSPLSATHYIHGRGRVNFVLLLCCLCDPPRNSGQQIMQKRRLGVHQSHPTVAYFRYSTALSLLVLSKTHKAQARAGSVEKEAMTIAGRPDKNPRQDSIVLEGQSEIVGSACRDVI
jgi:hypothetical protein